MTNRNTTVLEPSPAWERLVRIVGSPGGTRVEDFAGLSDATWAAFLAECNLHWLTPFVYRSLASHQARLAMPAAIWREFRTMYLLSRARTRRADAVLAPVLSAFDQAGIGVIAL
jgi:hypothetical protein